MESNKNYGGILEAEATTFSLQNVYSLDNSSNVFNTQTGRKRSFTNQQTEKTSRRKYKKFQFKRQRVNKMKRDRQGTLTQDIRTRKSFILKNLNIQGHGLESGKVNHTLNKNELEATKFMQLSNSTEPLETFEDFATNLQNNTPNNLPFNLACSASRNIPSYAVYGQQYNKNCSTPIEGTNKAPFNEANLECINNTYTVPVNNVFNKCRNVAINGACIEAYDTQNGACIGAYCAPIYRAYNAQINGSCVGVYNGPIDEARIGVNDLSTNVDHIEAYYAPSDEYLIGAFNSPTNGAHIGACDALTNVDHIEAYNAPVHEDCITSYNAQINGACVGAYNAPTNGAYNAQINGPCVLAYDAQINGACNEPLNISTNAQIQESFEAPITEAYFAPSVANYQQMYDADNAPMCVSYHIISNSLNDDVTNDIDYDSIYFTSPDAGLCPNDMVISSLCVDTVSSVCPPGTGLISIAIPTPSEEIETASGILFDDFAYVPNFFDLIS